ncbi:DUF1810 domain-containing protein [Rhabdobacter roseus]|uniref:Uncharacterized protein (DUF1810 family) n=1 Tax=Rhabdobacter roseus TaxID=1655419 RepID=A0A840TZZ9_9BACT|nr:DUF1810 domain-containing protein [Rhabdobacter roseus]MBB5285738.1 uncharacterized protein (DUF1810 family) [Rhabdobacter roseus]
MHASDELERFLTGQENVYPVALQEIKNGRKRSHWMWFVFPQVVGLGQTETSRYYGIQSREEALRYLHHPVLGKRLVEISEALLTVENKTASAIFGYPDDLKLKSSMTLFSAVSEEGSVFQRVLDRYFAGEEDDKTKQILNRMQAQG